MPFDRSRLAILAAVLVFAGFFAVALSRRLPVTDNPPGDSNRVPVPDGPMLAGRASSPAPSTESHAEPDATRVRVHVRDPRGHPLAGAKGALRRLDGTAGTPAVSLSPRGDDATWLEGLASVPGRYAMEVLRELYLPRTSYIEVLPGGVPVSLEIVLTRDMTAHHTCLFGAAVTDEGRPVPGALMSLRTNHRALEIAATREGEFEVWLESGEVASQLVVRPPDVTWGLREETIVSPAAGRFLRVTLPAIEMQLVDVMLDASELIADVAAANGSLQYVLLRPDGTVVQSVTQQSPTLFFKALRPGRYSVLARLGGSLSGSGHVVIGGSSPWRDTVHAEVLAHVCGRVDGLVASPGTHLRFLPASLVAEAERGSFDALLPAVLATRRFFYLEDAAVDVAPDVEGRFAAALPPGGYSTQVLSSTGVPLTAVRNVNIELPVTDIGVIHAQSSKAVLVFPPGSPEERADTRLVVYAPHGVLIGPLSSDAAGTYRVDGLPEGAYRAVLTRGETPGIVTAGPEVHFEITTSTEANIVVLPSRTR